MTKFLLNATRSLRTAWPVAGLLAWICVVGTGMGLLTAYVNRAEDPDLAPSYVSELASPFSHKYRLLMFAHPHCPCTAASLAELARVMARCADKVDATVHFFRPDDEPDEWVIGNLWRTAKSIPGVNVRIDSQALASTRFRSTISGEVLLYDPSGRLCFHGGITPARGHEGDSLGKSTVISIVTGDHGEVDHAPVFGCVFRPGTQPEGE
jgi:hypothetical protein